MAVLRLLKTELPHNRRKQIIEVQAEILRLGTERSSDSYWELLAKKHKTARASDYAAIEKAALEISSHLGMLSGRGPGDGSPEPLDRWVLCADRIQAIFFGGEAGRDLPKGLVHHAGQLDMVLFYEADGVSMHLLPQDTESALIYHATQMITGGTTLRTCEQCKSSFLSGGESRAGGKRRGDARFCSDRCRSEFHNRMRRKKKI
jgi:hypothetical protein